MEVQVSSRFKRAYRKLPVHIQDDCDKKLVLLIADPRHSSLGIHKLKGGLQDCLAFRLRAGYRVLFEFSSPQTIRLLSVGPHDLYRLWNKQKI